MNSQTSYRKGVAHRHIGECLMGLFTTKIDVSIGEEEVSQVLIPEGKEMLR